jgi:DNA modification methylase
MNDVTPIIEVLENRCRYGIFLGNCRQVLELFPPACIDCVITSPPYWQLRSYDIDHEMAKHEIGNEETPEGYVQKLVDVFRLVYKVLKPEGSLWLNIGDKYHNKNLMGMPWRVALALQNEGWILRNAVVWEQMKGTQSVEDRLRDVYEFIFHFVKRNKYYYDADQIRIKPRLEPTITDSEVISATGVNGKKYREQILQSKDLTDAERQTALAALEETLQQIRAGEIVDFRMTALSPKLVL